MILDGERDGTALERHILPRIRLPSHEGNA